MSAIVSKAPLLALSIPASHVDNALRSAYEAKVCTSWGAFYPSGDGLWYVEEESSRKVWPLAAWAISEGLAVLAYEAPNAFVAILADKSDATTGDALLQCIAFGEIKYEKARPIPGHLREKYSLTSLLVDAMDLMERAPRRLAYEYSFAVRLFDAAWRTDRDRVWAGYERAVEDFTAFYGAF